MSEIQKSTVNRVVIDADEAGQRLDNYLVRVCKGVPKSHVYRILRSGEVRVNSGRVDAAYRLQAGDTVRIPPIRLAEKPVATATAEVGMLRAELPVVYEDDALLAINKPAGIAVHGGSGLSFGVIEALRRQRPQARFLELAHRLDRETSGLLLIGKKRSALTALHDLFRHHRADKRYLALAKGRLEKPVTHVQAALHKYLTEDGERRVSVHEDGKASHSIFRLVARWQSASLVEAQIKTGRTHQIRVHLNHLGHPILGDEKYGDFALNKALVKDGLKRMFLHAWRLSFPHPLTGERLNLEAPLPSELHQYLVRLSAREQQDYGEAI